MNIFYTNKNPRLSAEYLDDLRLNKMILESCQMLSTTLHCLVENPPENLYKRTHENHPCSKWTRESKENFKWHLELLCYMQAEKLYRQGILEKPLFDNTSLQSFSSLYLTYKDKLHKSFQKLFPTFLEYYYKIDWQKLELTPHADCSNIESDKTIEEKYKICLEEKWKNDKRPPKFTRR